MELTASVRCHVAWLTVLCVGLCVVVGAGDTPRIRRAREDTRAKTLMFKERLPDRVRVPVGAEHRLRCTVNQWPVNITWFLNDSPITADTSYLDMRKATLRLKDAQPADAGRYRCVLTNSLGSLEHTFLLTIGEEAAPPGVPGDIPGAEDPEDLAKQEPEAGGENDAAAAAQSGERPVYVFPWGVLFGVVGCAMVIVLVGAACWGITTLKAMKMAAMRQQQAAAATNAGGQGPGGQGQGQPPANPEMERMMPA